MSIILFGSNCPAGAYFLNLNKNTPVEIWGRNTPDGIYKSHVYCDLSDRANIVLKRMDGILVSFAPIWLLAPFLNSALRNQPKALHGLKGVIACSSSSFMTKRFAANAYDRQLSKDLIGAHEVLARTCLELKVPCQILAPTLIYGNIGKNKDRNLNSIVSLMRRLPVVLLPENSGLRQPIHARQLAMVARHQANKMLECQWNEREPLILPLGGDEILSYRNMVLKIRGKLEDHDPGRRCHIVTIPARVYYLLIALVLPYNSKLFEALLRMQSDLSGFTKTCDVLETDCQAFPLEDIRSGE